MYGKLVSRNMTTYCFQKKGVKLIILKGTLHFKTTLAQKIVLTPLNNEFKVKI